MKKGVAYRRRNYFIKKRLQSRFILIFPLPVVAGFLLYWFAVYYILDKGLAEELYRSHIKVRTTGEVVLPLLWKLNIVTMPVIILAAGIVGYFFLRRIELPLSTFRKVAKALEEGDFTQRLSKGDSLEDLPEVFNETTERLEGAFRFFKGELNRLDMVIKRFDNLVKDKERPSPLEMRDILKDISDTRANLEKRLSDFKV